MAPQVPEVGIHLKGLIGNMERGIAETNLQADPLHQPLSLPRPRPYLNLYHSLNGKE